MIARELDGNVRQQRVQSRAPRTPIVDLCDLAWSGDERAWHRRWLVVRRCCPPATVQVTPRTCRTTPE